MSKLFAVKELQGGRAVVVWALRPSCFNGYKKGRPENRVRPFTCLHGGSNQEASVFKSAKASWSSASPLGKITVTP